MEIKDLKFGKMKKGFYDFRKDYAICNHVYENEETCTKYRGVRACCEECYEKGFLDLRQEFFTEIKQVGDYYIMKI